MADKYQEMVWQLGRLPGGAAAAIPDFFAPWLAGPEELTDRGMPCWRLREGARLCLAADSASGALRLTLDAQPIAEVPAELLAAASGAVSPLVLALLAIAAGDLDDGRRLKRLLPGVDAAAKDLMLMTLCRLCG